MDEQCEYLKQIVRSIIHPDDPLVRVFMMVAKEKVTEQTSGFGEGLIVRNVKRILDSDPELKAHLIDA